MKDMEINTWKTFLSTAIIVMVSFGLFLLFDLAVFSPVNRINYSNLILESTLSMFALIPLFAIQKYKSSRFYLFLNLGFYLLFASYLVDALDQLFLHSIIYTVFFEKITLIIAAIFIFIGSKQWMRSYEIISLTDDLTEVANRRLIRQLVTEEIIHYRNSKAVFSLAIIDIDYFKAINDKYGHHIGDKTLKLFAQLIKSSIGAQNKLGRWGGEEFLLLLKNKDIQQAQECMSELRRKIEQYIFSVAGQSIKMTISIGISQIYQQDEEFERLFNNADINLFKAKQLGRNRVEICAASKS